MGRYYAMGLSKAPELDQPPQRYVQTGGEPQEIADAIRDHYKPQGPADTVPTDPLTVAVALADKIDTLAGFWSIGETPTGSKDPFALRRAALGVIRIDRLKVYLRDKGARYDLIDAALGARAADATGAAEATLSQQQDDLLMIKNKIEALEDFLGAEDGQNLLAGYKRACNILKAEEKKDGTGAYDACHAPNLRIEAEEHKLAAAIARAKEEIGAKLKKEDFTGAMHSLSKLREPVDRFFDRVTVNAENADLRLNRLRLLSELRQTMNAVADFDKVTGGGDAIA